MSFLVSFLFVLLAYPLGAQGGVYKWVDGEGRVHFSDRPVENAQAVHLYEQSASQRATTQEQTADGPSSYTAFELMQPEDNQTLRTDEGKVPLALLLQPALQQGHKIQIILDGSPISGQFTSTQLTLRQVSKGTHRLHAVVVDAEGTEQMRSQEINFHVRQGAQTAPTASY